MTMMTVLSRLSCRAPRRIFLTSVLTVCVAALGLPPLEAQAAGAVGMDNFQLSGLYVLEVDGQMQPGAHIYFSNSANSYIVKDKSLPQVYVLTPGSTDVKAVADTALVARADGGFDLAGSASPTSVTELQVESGNVAFAVAGHKVVLKPKPDLLGDQKMSYILKYLPEYERGSQAYKPSPSIIKHLKDHKTDVKVQIYFGSWCPHCREMVPRVIKVAEQLAGSHIHFAFYGLPHPLSADPVTNRMGIQAVPTGIIYVKGKEIGRIVGGGWEIPELSLQNLLLNKKIS